MVSLLILPTKDIVQSLRQKLVPLLDAEYCIAAMLEEIVEIAFTFSTLEDIDAAVRLIFINMVVNYEDDKLVYHRAYLDICLEFVERFRFCGLGDCLGTPYRFKSMLGDDIVVVHQQHEGMEQWH